MSATDERTCGVCGRRYPADDPRGTCPVCWPGFGEHAETGVVTVPRGLLARAAGKLLDDAVLIDGEWGSGRDVDVLRAAGDDDGVRLADMLNALLPHPTESAEPMRTAQGDDPERLIEFAERLLGARLDPWQVRLCRRVFGGNVGRITTRPEWRFLAGSGAATVQPGKGRLTPPPSTVEQPTPSAEPNLTERLAELQHPVNGHRPHCLSNQPGDGPCNCNIATPPSIADMTPGTTFTDADGRRLTFAINPWGVKYAVTEDRREVPLPDPSTIRDVTPPPVTP